MQETQETWVKSLGREDPLEKEMATHSSILAWEIPLDRGAWQGGSWTRLSNFTFTFKDCRGQIKGGLSFPPP